MDHKSIIENFLSNPSETLKIELKEWIDISTETDKAKIVKSCIALYNNNGGFLAIGFDNDGKTKKHTHTLAELKEKFNFDEIQKIVSRYTSTHIETYIYFHEIDNLHYPFIFIPSGVRTPASIKADLHDPTDHTKKLLHHGKIYFRTLSSNGTVSTSEPKSSKDWERLLNICLENKETDIAKFFQNNLTEAQLQKIKEFLFRTSNEPSQNNNHDAKNCLNYGYKEYLVIANKKSIPTHGTFQVAFIINNKTEKITISQTLLQTLKSSNPRPSGWPLWVILQNSPDEDKRPQHHSDRWQAFIDASNTLDFWMVTEKKCFYHYRALRDDMNGSTTAQAKAEKLNEIDFVWQVENICDAIATGLAFAQALNEDGDATLAFAFKWTKLKNRYLTAWAHPARYIDCESKSNTDECSHEVNISINATRANIVNYTYEVACHLFLTFGGYDRIARDTIADIVINYLKWK